MTEYYNIEQLTKYTELSKSLIYMKAVNHTMTFGYSIRHILRSIPEICEAIEFNRLDLHELVERTIMDSRDIPMVHDLYYSQYEVDYIVCKCIVNYRKGVR